MTAAPEQNVDRLVLDCCRDLFSAYGVELEPKAVEDDPQPNTPTVFIAIFYRASMIIAIP